MSSRVQVWLIGLALTAAALGWLARDEANRELILPLALLALAVSALIAEAAGLRSLARNRMPPRPPEGALPADGVVDVVPMTSIRSEPLAGDPRWRRFGRLEDEGPRPGPRLDPATPALLGHVALISVFVGRDGRPWSDPEIVRAHQSLERVGRWIEREAARHAAPLNIGLADTFFRVEDDEPDLVQVAYSDEGDDVGPMEADASTKLLVGASRAAALLGFADVADLVARVNPRVAADVRVWLIHLRRAGRSLAVPAFESGISGVGLAACYAREASFPEPLIGPGRVDPTSVAHELLHLFGASDKYGVALRSFAAGSVTSRDIMRLDHESLSRLTIDLLTASEIGWGHAIGPAGTKKTARGRGRPGAV